MQISRRRLLARRLFLRNGRCCNFGIDCRKWREQSFQNGTFAPRVLLIALILHTSIRNADSTNCYPGQLSDTMNETDVLVEGQAIVSSDGLKMLFLGTDGTLQLFNQQVSYWSAYSDSKPKNRYLILQSDGN